MLELLSEIGRFTDFVGAATRQLEGAINVMADDSFAFELEVPLARTIARVHERFPGLQLNLRMTAPDRIFASVLEGSADLGFTALIRPSDAFEAVPVGLEEMGLFCGRGHPLFDAADETLTEDDLRRYDFVAAEVTQGPEVTAFVSGLRIRAAAPTILSRMLLIISSRYLGFAPVEFAQYWVRKGSIREITMPAGRYTNQCYVIHRRARPLGIGGGIFRGILLDELRSRKLA
ncbi:MAG: substrate-binding domain-containing protein [Amaricoccus sp.]|uniref:substrate-binding domain-containing protein n=1 Tax=Amaricoccus sp. TaxID=1872485 RepID=UPI0039E42A37